MNPTEHKSDEPEFSDGCDHDGFQGGCERFGHSKENCPYVKHKSETPKCLHCDKTLDVKAPPAETVCENCGAHGVIKKSETPEKVTPEEAFQILQRFNNSHFRDRSMGECARYSIPARPDRDDDLRLKQFIDQYSALEIERDQLRARVGELEKAIRNHVEASNNDDSAGDSFGVLIEIIKAIDEARKGQE